jgi:outer membrane autotransporter protein
VQGARPARDHALAGVGVVARFADNLSLFLRYDGDFGGGDAAHAVQGGLRVRW